MLLLPLAIGVKAWHDTLRDPVVRRTQVVLAGLTPGSATVQIALISDIHVSRFDMPPARLASIVRQINALRPDIVLIAGDVIGEHVLVANHVPAEQAIAPLAALTAPLGVFAVPGNHDYTTDMPGIARAMQRHGISLLVDDVIRTGPLVIGGLDDERTGRVDLAGVIQRMKALPGGRVLLTHTPDFFPQVPRAIGLTLAGHTHCGQIGWPAGLGAPITMSRYGQRYACGRVNEGGKVLVTTAGLGTSGLPIRLFEPPDLWLIEARPPARKGTGGR